MIECSTQPGLPAAMWLSMPLNPLDPRVNMNGLKLEHRIEEPHRCQDQLKRPLEVPRFRNGIGDDPLGLSLQGQ